MKLRDYQSEAVAAVCRELQTHDSTLLVLATGLGKTVTFAHVAKLAVERGGRVLMIAHRQELIFQARDKFKQVCGVMPDIEMGDLRANEGLMPSPIVCATVQTLAAGRHGNKRIDRFNADDFKLLVIDEAHHATADSYQAVIEWIKQHPKAKVLGVTATPDRSDDTKLGHIFKSIAYELGILDGIMLGWLVDVKQEMVYVEGLDFSGISTRNGDFAPDELAAVLEAEKPLHEIAKATIERSEGRKTLVFAASVAQADKLAEVLDRYEPGSARLLTGETPGDERRAMLRDYADGRFRFLCNVGVATEGFDDPGIGCVVMARPTKSRPLYAQCLGRGTRVLPGVIDGVNDPEDRVARIRSSAKPNVLILDFVGNCGRHTLVSSIDVLGDGSPPEVVERARKMLADAGGDPTEVRRVLRDAETMEAEERERREREQAERDRRRGIRAEVSYTVKSVSPFSVLDLTPAPQSSWAAMTPASSKQTAWLAKWGIDATTMNAADAKKISNEIYRRLRAGVCSYKQAKLLKKYGLNTEMSFEDAKRAIDALAANGWKRPANV